ncbi:hypothetical protein ACFPIJ_32855 [Dactylosporangium cerinum]|uniref:Uncharacterized protein n=1 Tax=Dactylosporangium cerinum TaxID=1434730 RepID=A0ABV9W1S2_9ACTN
MPEDAVRTLVTESVERHRPDQVPPFETITARWRRRRTIRRGAAAAAAVAVAAVAVPVALSTRSVGPGPQVAAPSVSASRLAGRVPLDVTGVSACHGADCRTVSDPGQVQLLVDDLNSTVPLNGYQGPCEPDPAGVTLTFSGPNVPYPVVTVFTSCTWWMIRGESQRYDASVRARDSVLQAQKFGMVVHDCYVTSPYLEPGNFATDYVGLTLAEAQSQAGRRGVLVRVLGEDGNCGGLINADAKGRNRVNLYLEGGRVKSASYF